MTDAEVLERAAGIVRARAKGKRSFVLDVLCSVLRRVAARIRAESENR
jgi:hypothetical protein